LRLCLGCRVFGMIAVETPGNTATDLQTGGLVASPVPSLANQDRPCCEATTKAGTPCQMPPLIGTRFCHSHTPGLAAEAGRRGGLNRRRTPKPTPRKPAARVAPDSPVASLPDVKLDSAAAVHNLLEATLNQLRRGEIDARVGSVILRMIETASKVVVQVELDRRLADLEQSVVAKDTK
jgi:hypothetical protein